MSADGNVFAVGAKGFDMGGNGRIKGYVRIYKYNESTWSWTQIGEIDGEAIEDHFGFSVSLSSDGTTVAIGAEFNDGNDTNDSRKGNVRVYKYDATKTTANSNGPIGWNKLGSDIDGEAYFDHSGYSVSISADGTIVAIGAIYNDGNNSNSGHVRVHKYDGNNWSQHGGDIDGEAGQSTDDPGDQSGYSVSLSSDGTILAIGAPFNDGDGTQKYDDRGQVRLYKYDATKTTANSNGPIGWNKLGNDIDGSFGQKSGSSVSLSSDGTVVAIGAPGLSIGTVRVYKYNESNWTQLGGNLVGKTSYDNFGYSVSISADGSIVAVSAPKNNNNNGCRVSVFKYDATKTTADTNGPIGWNKLGTDMVGESVNDEFGNSVSISADGTVMVVGAPYNDTMTGINSGNVRVFKIDSYVSTTGPRPNVPLSTYNVNNLTWTTTGFQSNDDTAYENYISFTMPETSEGHQYKYKVELLNDNTVKSTTIVEWEKNKVVKILLTNLIFLASYTFKVSLFNSSDNTMTEGVVSGVFTTPAQTVQIPSAVKYAGTINTTDMSIIKEITGFSRPQAVAVNGVTGNLFVADTGNRVINKYDPNGNFIKQWTIGEVGEECICLAFDNRTSLFALTQKPDTYTGGGGFFYEYDENDSLIRKFRIDDYTLPHFYVGCFAFDKNNNMWLAERYVGGSNKMKAYDITPKTLDNGYLSAPQKNEVGIPRTRGFIMGMAFDRNNNLYYTLNNGGFYKYNFNSVNNSFQEDVTNYRTPLLANSSFGISLDASDKIAVMTQKVGTTTTWGIQIVSNNAQNIYNFGFELFNFPNTGSAPLKYTHHYRMQVMPNGNILMPDVKNNRVCIIGSTTTTPPVTQ
jgi:hypothetical protein